MLVPQDQRGAAATCKSTASDETAAAPRARRHAGRVSALLLCIVIDTLHLNGHNVNEHFGTFTRGLLMH